MALLLIVEDDDEVRRLLKTLIESQGHQVLEARGSDEAAALLDKKPDAALVDVDMPGETGPEFLLRLRKHPVVGQIPAMFATAFPDRISRLRHTGLAAGLMLEKPFRKQDVVKALEALLKPKRG